MVALLEVAPDEISAYGAAEVEERGDDTVRLRSVVEKPAPDDAPSNLAVIGRYVFTPAIFDALERIEPGAGGELQLTDAIGVLMQRRAGLRAPVHARAATTPARRSTTCGPTSSWRSTAPTSRPSVEAMLVEVVRRRGCSPERSA